MEELYEKRKHGEERKSKLGGEVTRRGFLKTVGSGAAIAATSDALFNCQSSSQYQNTNEDRDAATSLEKAVRRSDGKLTLKDIFNSII